MAKAKRKVKLSSTNNGITYVNSKAYQPHVRAERGTYTAISLADGMKESTKAQTQANLMAKIVFDTVNNFSPNFKDGKFWSRLVAVFRQLLKQEHTNRYKLLQGMEVRPDYPTSKQGSFLLKKKLDAVQLHYSLKVDTDYRLSILRMATDRDMLIPYAKEIITINIRADELQGVAQLNFASVADEASLLYVMKCEQLINGKLEGLLSQKSVSFLKVS